MYAGKRLKMNSIKVLFFLLMFTVLGLRSCTVSGQGISGQPGNFESIGKLKTIAEDAFTQTTDSAIWAAGLIKN
jgi:hypothetical protein